MLRAVQTGFEGAWIFIYDEIQIQINCWELRMYVYYLAIVLIWHFFTKEFIENFGDIPFHIFSIEEITSDTNL